MKYFLSCFFLVFNFVTNAQQADLENSISELELKIEQSEKGERLKWMDSLTTLVKFNGEFNYDSIVQQTINFALILDSLNVATRNTYNHVYYKNRVLGKPKDGIDIFTAFLDKAELLNNDKTKSIFYYQGANAYRALYDLDPTLKYYKIAKEFALKGNQELLGMLALDIGGMSIEKGLSAEASQELQTAIKIFREQKDTMGIIDAKNNMSILYSQHAFYKEAKIEREEAISLTKAYSGNTFTTGSLLYFNAAADYREIGDQPNRIKYIKLAIENNDSENKDFLEPIFLCELIIALAENDSLEQAEKYFKQIGSDLETYAGGRYKGAYIETVKQLELARGNYAKSLNYGKQHLELMKESGVYVEIMNAEKFLSDVFKKMSDDNNSNKHLLTYYQIKDSITNVQNAKNLLLYQTLYETEKRDYMIEAQKKDIALLNTQNKIKNQWLLFGGVGLLSIFGFVLIVRSRNTARREKKLQESFSQDLISAQENERSRVAFELHDSVGQQLMMIKRKSKNNGDVIMESLTSSTLENLRFISRNLHPIAIEQLGLTVALRDLVADFEDISDTEFEADIDEVGSLLNKKVELHIYRIFQEVLSNIIKHANAKQAFISVKKEASQLKLYIKDTGKGFNFNDKIKTSKSLGMKSLNERCKIIKANLKIDSTPKQGTEIMIVLPY